MRARTRTLLSLAVSVAVAGCGDDTIYRPMWSDAGPDGAARDAQLDALRGDGRPREAGPDTFPARKPLAPGSLPRYTEPLVIPPAMPPESKTAALTSYAIAAREIRQQILPSGYPRTTVWAYGRAGDPLYGTGLSSSYNSPGFTIEARVNEKVRVEWVNGLVDGQGDYRPHLLPVDQTLHWANPPGPPDSMSMNPAAYLGPVPIVTHVHGAHVAAVSDGHPEAWYLPAALNIPSGYSLKGTHFGSAQPAPAGSAIFEYTNDQRASTLWYHDHALGITRLNVYAGLAGFWILRDDAEDKLGLPGPSPRVGDPPGTRYYEIPIAIQDRSFWDDGSLRYPSSRAEFDDYKGPYVPASKVPPVWNPEFFGDTMMVNGRTWPLLEVEPRLYRFRLLNGCSSRFLILKLDRASLSFQQIGNEGGLLPDKPLAQTELLLAPAERADVLVDFSSLKEGDEVVLLNLGPDEPYKGPDTPLAAADPKTTGQVLKLRVVKPTGQGVQGSVPASLPPVAPLSTALPPRDLTLSEEMEHTAEIPIAAKLGTPAKGPQGWSASITESVKQGSTEIWRIINLTADAHPIHLHLVSFQVLDRRRFDVAYRDKLEEYWEKGGVMPKLDDHLLGTAQAARAWERGYKDTVIANPGEVTRVIATFDLSGLYVWHCHILEHEDNEMMRPFEVVP